MFGLTPTAAVRIAIEVDVERYRHIDECAHVRRLDIRNECKCRQSSAECPIESVGNRRSSGFEVSSALHKRVRLIAYDDTKSDKCSERQRISKCANTEASRKRWLDVPP